MAMTTYNVGDYVYHKHSGLIKRITYKGTGVYSDAWMTDYGYVWKSGIRPATAEEIATVGQQRIKVVLL